MPYLCLLCATRDPISGDEFAHLAELRTALEAIAQRQRSGRILSIVTRKQHVEYRLKIDGRMVAEEDIVSLLQQLNLREGVRLYYRDGKAFERMPYP